MEKVRLYYPSTIRKILKYYSNVVLRKTELAVFETVPQTMVCNSQDSSKDL